MNDTHATSQLLMTPAQLAEQFQVSRSTAYRWIRSGEVPSVRLGGTVRIPAKPLVDRLTRNTARGHYGALIGGAHAGIAGRLDALEAQLEQAVAE